MIEVSTEAEVAPKAKKAMTYGAAALLVASGIYAMGYYHGHKSKDPAPAVAVAPVECPAVEIDFSKLPACPSIPQPKMTGAVKQTKAQPPSTAAAKAKPVDDGRFQSYYEMLEKYETTER